MNDIDHLALDGHSLRLFLAVLEEGSVTKAAARLGMTQSAVSHGLQRLREIVRDPLFVKSGRGIVATAHALGLGQRARALLDEMRQFASGAAFEPAGARLSFVIAANDLQRDLFLPGLFRRIERAVEHVSFRVIPAERPTPAVLREGRCDLLISPRPPAGIDILQKLLLRDRYVCFYDPSVRAGPESFEDYLASRHISVVYSDETALHFDLRAAELGIRRDMAVTVPGFGGIPAFLKGTAMLASLPSLLATWTMRDFAAAQIPLGDRAAVDLLDLPLFMAWHRRHQDDPAHKWLRQQLEAVCAGLGRA